MGSDSHGDAAGLAADRVGVGRVGNGAASAAVEADRGPGVGIDGAIGGGPVTEIVGGVVEGGVAGDGFEAAGAGWGGARAAPE